MFAVLFVIIQIHLVSSPQKIDDLFHGHVDVAGRNCFHKVDSSPRFCLLYLTLTFSKCLNFWIVTPRLSLSIWTTTNFPFLKRWTRDGGHFSTVAICTTGGCNISLHRSSIRYVVPFKFSFETFECFLVVHFYLESALASISIRNEIKHLRVPVSCDNFSA
jgi:hypothetical protein